MIVVECKEEQINERQFQVAVDQAYSYAHSLASQYIWVTSGIKDEYFEIVELYPVERISISDIPKRSGKVDRYKYVKGAREPQGPNVGRDEATVKLTSIKRSFFTSHLAPKE